MSARGRDETTPQPSAPAGGRAPAAKRPGPAKRAVSTKRAPATAGGTRERTAPSRGAVRARWNPNIVVFACNWCSYAGADTAGVSRIQQEPHFRMIGVMCSGRIQPGFVLRAFEKGADGVLVSGCHFGDCHYIFGNHRAVEQFDRTRELVRILGLEDGRLRLEWISAAEGARFAQVIAEFTERIRSLGPSPLSSRAAAV